MAQSSSLRRLLETQLEDCCDADVDERLDELESLDDAVPTDPSAPEKAGFCIRQAGSKQVHLNVKSVARDPETGVDGYRYRLRTETGTVLRDWPAEDDWAGEDVSSGMKVDLGPFTLQSATPYYLDLRARNGQGKTTMAASGPLYVDRSAPPRPSLYQVAASSSGADWAVLVEGNIPNDPETGITRVEWRILDPNVGLVAEGELQAVGIGYFQTVVPVAASAFEAAGTYTFYLNTVNAVGMSSSTASAGLSPRSRRRWRAAASSRSPR